MQISASKHLTRMRGQDVNNACPVWIKYFGVSYNLMLLKLIGINPSSCWPHTPSIRMRALTFLPVFLVKRLSNFHRVVARL
jgi:hypothetical protein